MRLLSFEHGRAAYRADFVLYGVAVAGLSVLLLAVGPSGHGLALGASLLAGVLGWSLIEYLLHRFVLHGVAPFRRWHEQHHARPTALICTPTLLSATLIGLFVFLPAALLGDRWMACALTLGLLVGYLGYAVTHHAIHHWRGDGAWLMRRKRWHALHHRRGGGARCYGVTGAFWDRVFGSAPTPAAVRQRTDAVAATSYKRDVNETTHSLESRTP
jgi:sterol desaturase/sphingolipid hydroxylase (fatty acid hydroxylase superfamily)